MKKFMKNEGFTLVELIVVIAILGILAAVAVPAYSGYITKANDASVITELDAIATAAQAANATAGEIGSIEVTESVIKVTAASGKTLAADFDANFVTYYGCTDSDTTANQFTAESGKKYVDFSKSTYASKKAVWSGGTWTAQNAT